MRLHRPLLAAALAVSLLGPRLAHGAGYAIYEQGASVLGMAGAGTASVSDASANYFNPAALVRMGGKQLQLGGSWLQTRTSFAGVGPYPGYGVTEEMKTGNFYPPTGYWSARVGAKWAYGLGFNAPYGLGVDWKNPDTFTDRAYVTKADLRSLVGNLNVAYQATPTVSVAAGFDAIFASVELRRIEPSGKPIPGGGGAPLLVRAHLKGDYTPGYTGNAALLWTPNADWTVGINYRASAKIKIDNGEADFALQPTGNPAVDAAAADSLPPKQHVSTELTMPSLVSVGVAWKPSPDWTWELDVNRTGWKQFKELALAFDQTPALNTTVNEDYQDAWRVSIGGERRMTRVTYRLGYYFDQAAAPTKSVTTLLPDANRHGASVGLSWALGQRKAWTLDVYDLSVFVENRSTENQNSHGFDGTYKSYVNASGLSLAYRW